MMRSAYITADKFATGTGGGVVIANELEALRSVSAVDLVLSRDNINPELFKIPLSPFLEDYFALQQVQGQKFDIAHFYSGCFTETARYLKEHGTKVTYTVAAHNRKLSIEEFQRFGMDYPFLHISDDGLWRKYTEGIRLADLVIAPSRKSAETLKSDIGCQNVKIIPHGVNWPRKVETIPDNFNVAYLGAVGPDKGLIYLIQAWSMLNYHSAKLVLAGPGTETLDSFIYQVASHGHFITLGRVRDVAEIYNACSVYIQPSVTEAFGIEIPEAMSYGRPVIASQGAGAAEIVGKGGFVVPIRSPEAIAEHIDKLKTNRDLMLSMGESGRLIARNYTWGKIRGKYAKVFSSFQTE
jgi:glycosyltransferase involved in cell wall biosynthesis